MGLTELQRIALFFLSLAARAARRAFGYHRHKSSKAPEEERQ
jgi:hypothetical protein